MPPMIYHHPKDESSKPTYAEPVTPVASARQAGGLASRIRRPSTHYRPVTNNMHAHSPAGQELDSAGKHHVQETMQTLANLETPSPLQIRSVALATPASAGNLAWNTYHHSHAFAEEDTADVSFTMTTDEEWRQKREEDEKALTEFAEMERRVAESTATKENRPPPRPSTKPAQIRPPTRWSEQVTVKNPHQQIPEMDPKNPESRKTPTLLDWKAEVQREAKTRQANLHTSNLTVSNVWEFEKTEKERGFLTERLPTNSDILAQVTNKMNTLCVGGKGGGNKEEISVVPQGVFLRKTRSEVGVVVERVVRHQPAERRSVAPQEKPESVLIERVKELQEKVKDLEGQLGAEKDKTEYLEKRVDQLTERNRELEDTIAQLRSERLTPDSKCRSVESKPVSSECSQSTISLGGQVLRQDGDTTYYANGDVMKVEPGVKTYWHTAAGICQIFKDNGVRIIEFPDGQRETHYPDGSAEVSYPDGSHVMVLPDGEEIHRLEVQSSARSI
eukprot:comp41543_c0_seq1/m.47446 comp41543_c0_seq1/g.47446  ORF comp41543_c0_seq1/g.47446 comp41543_c0_seq1/m.47446 type:complete len:503 (-) comp41543_c0_seq1:18-1526(-)